MEDTAGQVSQQPVVAVEPPSSPKSEPETTEAAEKQATQTGVQVETMAKDKEETVEEKKEVSVSTGYFGIMTAHACEVVKDTVLQNFQDGILKSNFCSGNIKCVTFGLKIVRLTFHSRRRKGRSTVMACQNPYFLFRFLAFLQV